MKWLAALVCAFCMTSALAAPQPEMTLEEMAAQADHVIVGVVTGADMIDSAGNQVTDEKAMTGTALKNTIRLRIQVNKVLVSNVKKVPKVLMVPLDPSLPYSLGQIKSAHADHPNAPFLVLLKGPDFQPLRPGRFGQPLEKKDEVMKAYKAAHK